MSLLCWFSFFFTDPATTEIYTLSLHDALPICCVLLSSRDGTRSAYGTRLYAKAAASANTTRRRGRKPARLAVRSEEHTSELQSRRDLVCRLLLEKKKKKKKETSDDKEEGHDIG